MEASRLKEPLFEVRVIVPLEVRVANFSFSFNSNFTLLGVSIVTVLLFPFKELLPKVIEELLPLLATMPLLLTSIFDSVPEVVESFIIISEVPIDIERLPTDSVMESLADKEIFPLLSVVLFNETVK